MNSYTVLANLWYDVAAVERYNITPYIGGGIGLGIIDLNISDAAVALGDPEDLTGVGYRFSCIIADIDGRDSIGLDFPVNNAEIYNHNVIGNIKYNF